MCNALMHGHYHRTNRTIDNNNITKANNFESKFLSRNPPLHKSRLLLLLISLVNDFTQIYTIAVIGLRDSRATKGSESMRRSASDVKIKRHLCFALSKLRLMKF